MDHGDYYIDLLNQRGEIIGRKPRREVDKQRDIYHAVHILLITPAGNWILAAIPSRRDLPNLYTGLWGTAAATILRSREGTLAAAQRALKNELHIADGRLELLGSTPFAHNGVQRHVTAYYLVHEPPRTYSTADAQELTALKPLGLEQLVRDEPDRFAPTFLHLWQAYGPEVMAATT